MVKRKAPAASSSTKPSEPIRNGQDDSDSESDTAMLDVEFEFFDPQELDFHGLKMLLRQLLDTDAELFDLSAIASAILAQPLLGTTVKCPDDEHAARENDPFAFLTVLSLAQPAIRPLAQYIADKTSSNPAFEPLRQALQNNTNAAQFGLVLTERFVNMPAEIVPPLYSMLLEEMQWAREDGEPYEFTHYLVLSKTYIEVASQLPDVAMEDAEEEKTDRAAKKPKVKRKDTGGGGAEVFYFHPEDEVLKRHALACIDFKYTKEGAEGASDAKRAFQEAGIKPMGHVSLLESGRFDQAVADMKAYLAPGT